MTPVAARSPRDLLAAAATLGFAGAINRRTLLGAPRQPATARARQWAASLEGEGYGIIEGFATPERCAEYRAEIDRAFAELPEYVRVQSDERMFGIEHASASIAEFANDEELRSTAETHWREPGKTMATLGARLEVRPGGRGSGEGWHRDSYFRQFKAILYLSDVEADNGPFQLIRGSHTLGSLLRDGVVAGLGYRQTRFADAQVEALVAEQPSRLLTVTGKAGTLIVVNTCAIHRGKPIVSGRRYALTNYYMPDRMITPRRLEQLHPLLRPGVAGPIARSA